MIFLFNVFQHVSPTSLVIRLPGDLTKQPLLYMIHPTVYL